MKFSAYQKNEKEYLGIGIKSAGHIFAKEGREIYRPQGTDTWLLFYIHKGDEIFVLKNREILLSEGSFIIFKPREFQRHFHKSSVIGEFYYTHFTVKDENLIGFSTQTPYKIIPNVKVTENFEEIINLLQQNRGEELTVLKLLENLALFKMEKNKAPEINRYESLIYFAVQTINRHYNEELSLDYLASSINMSKFHFLHMFEKIIGTTPIQYRNTLRIDHAKELLRDTSYSVTEISEKIGIDSPTYFCEFFKRYTGVSPRDYRKKGEKI